MPSTRPRQEAPAQASARHPLILCKSTPGLAFSTGRPRGKAAWRNTLALAAVAVAIALVVVKNKDRNPSIQFLKGAAIFEASGQPKANP
jgi:hypothetical protein